MSRKLQTRRPARPKAASARVEAAALPSRDQVLAFIAGDAAPDGARAPARVTKREIARAFGVQGDQKGALKLLIKDLEADGAIARGRKTLRPQGRLPGMVVADVIERDRDGELVARPAEWLEAGEPPRIRSCARAPSAKAGPRPASARAC